MKKSSFIVWWLVIELLIKLLKAHLPLNKTKPKKNSHKPSLPPPPSSRYKPTSRFSCVGSGADVSLNFLSRSLLMKMSERAAVGSGNHDHRL